MESHFNKFVGLQACNFIKKRIQYRYFPVNFAKFLRTPFLQNTSSRLLLKFGDFNYPQPFPTDIYLLKVKKRNITKRCEICSMLTINTLERRHWLILVFLLLNFCIGFYFSIDRFQCLHISSLLVCNSDVINSVWRKEDAER